jgi:uncharacterized Zn finger protein
MPTIGSPAPSPRFDRRALVAVAGQRTFERGVGYHRSGAVEIVDLEGERVLARVAGSEVYRVELHGRGRRFDGSCTCPAFAEMGFCKHLVATALTVNDGAGSTGRLERVREHLYRQGLEALVALVMRLAEDDPPLLQQLELAAVVDSADGAELVPRLRRAIDTATDTPGYVHYREVPTWVDGVERVLDSLRPLVEGGRPEALDLIERLQDRLEEAIESIDDSDGEVGRLMAAARTRHIDACLVLRPEPVALARRLFTREVESDWGLFGDADAAYAEVLGEQGLAEYRRLAEAAWGAADRDTRRLALLAILDRFAERDGDLDRRIRLRLEAADSQYAYLGIAMLCEEHGREEEALAHAERGLALEQRLMDQRLARFAADLYRRAGRERDAADLLWRAFEGYPSLEGYQELRKQAPALGERAIALLESRLGAEGRGRSAPGMFREGGDLLVRMLIEAPRIDEAWRVARVHGCLPATLARLARAAEPDRLDLALDVHAELVERTVARTNRGAYEEACRLLDHMAGLRERSGRTSEHRAHLQDLARRHKAKRILIKLLAERLPQGG